MNDQARVSLQPAYILHRRPYRETSLLLELFSADHGRVGMIARGVRRGKGASQGLLQPFIPLSLSWTAKSDLVTLTGVEPRQSFAPLSGLGLISAFYVNELLLRLLHRHEPHEELFIAYELVLRRLAAVPEQQEWHLRLFEKALLQELGYGIILDHETDSGIPIQPHLRYKYLPQYGPVPFDSKQQGITVHGSTLLALQQENSFDSQILLEAKRLMRHELQSHLGDAPLRSRELFRDTMLNMAPGPGTKTKEDSSEYSE